MSDKPLMPKATAVWLIENTSLTFEQIADFCGIHPLEVKGIADEDVAKGIKGIDPVATGQLTHEQIEQAEKNPEMKLAMAPTLGFARHSLAISAPISKSSVCTRTGISASRDRREDRDLVAWPHRGRAVSHLLVDRDANRLGRGKLRLPGAATGAQTSQKPCDIPNPIRQCEVLLRGPDGLAQARKQQHDRRARCCVGYRRWSAGQIDPVHDIPHGVAGPYGELYLPCAGCSAKIAATAKGGSIATPRPAFQPRRDRCDR